MCNGRPRSPPWVGAGGETVNSCAIITTGANDTVSPIHERMPAIFDPERLGACRTCDESTAGGECISVFLVKDVVIQFVGNR